MLDWASRIDELVAKLDHEYGIRDRLAVEILLAALIKCPRTADSWIILETNWYQRECLDAWFSFGQQWIPWSLARLRVRYPWRYIEAEMESWFDQPCAHLFVEPDWERYPYFYRLTLSEFLLQRALRVRTLAPRGRSPLYQLDQREQARRADELAAATRYVTEDHVHARPEDPPRFREPRDFFYHCELVQRLAPWYADWHDLIKTFALVAVRHAYLYGRTETNEEDNAVMARIARDTIPPWVSTILKMLLEGPHDTRTLHKRMGLEEWSRRCGHGAQRELWRLHRREIVRWDRYKQHWAIMETHRNAIHAALEGRVFGS